MKHAIIFDLDGIIMDTERLHAESLIVALKSFGTRLTHEEFLDHWTRQGKSITHFVEERGLSLDVDEVRNEKRKVFFNMIEKTNPVIEGTGEVLESLSKHFTLALASSSKRPDVDFILNFSNFARYFEFTVSESESGTQKPDPECFRMVCRKLGVQPENCIVIEDTEKGVNAAHSIGMKSIAIPRDYSRDHDFSNATFVLSDIREVTPDFILKAFEQGQ